jgi:N-acetylmuramoyl-L-alanine amidase
MTPKVSGFIISSGHTNVVGKDMGASSVDGKYVEGVLTVADKNILVKKMYEAAAAENIVNFEQYMLVDRDDTALADTMAFLKGRTKATDVLIEIHYNASDNTTVKGTEVLIPEIYTSEETEIADRLSDVIGDVLGTKERGQLGATDGVKTEADSKRKKLGWMRMVGINILIELEFLSNPTAMQTLEQKRDELWTVAAKYLVGLLKQTLKQSL